MTVLVVVLIGFLAVESAALVVVVGRWVAAVGRPPERVEVESKMTAAAWRDVSDRVITLAQRDVVPSDVMRQMLRGQAKAVEDVTRAVAAAVAVPSGEYRSADASPGVGEQPATQFDGSDWTDALLPTPGFTRTFAPSGNGDDFGIGGPISPAIGDV